MNDTIINHSEEKITEVALEECSLTLHQKGTLLVAMYGATIGKLGILNIESTTNQACCGCKPEDYVNVWYLFYYFLTIRDDLRDRGYGGAQPNISKQVIERLLLPLPPIQEQIRIIEKLQKVEIIINDLIDCHEKFDTINRTISEDIRQSILQFAIKGKLTHHDPNLEPVQIQCKNPIVRRDNSYYEIIDGIESECDEIPFMIPESWSYYRFSDVADFYLGKTPSRSVGKYWNNGNIPWVSISDMVDGCIINQTKEHITEEAFNDCFSDYCKEGTLLMSFKLSIGKVSITGMECLHNEAIISIYPKKGVKKEWLMAILPMLSKGIKASNAVKGNTLNKKTLSRILVPVPPIDEQERILRKFDILNCTLKSLDVI